MKKQIITLTVLIGFILLPIRAKAFNKGYITITCDKTTLEVSDTTTCKITGYADGDVNGLQFKLLGNDVITISDITKASGWEGDGADGNVMLYTDESKYNNFDIATFKITAKEAGEGKVYTTGLLFSDGSFANVYLTNVSLNLTIKAKQTTSDPSNGSGNTNDSSNGSGNTNDSSNGSGNTNDPSNVNGNSSSTTTGSMTTGTTNTSSTNTSTVNKTNNDSIKNPKTGVYSIGFVALVALILFTGVILYKKNYFLKVK